jgi:hypothetical protein
MRALCILEGCHGRNPAGTADLPVTRRAGSARRKHALTTNIRAPHKTLAGGAADEADQRIDRPGGAKQQQATT